MGQFIDPNDSYDSGQTGDFLQLQDGGSLVKWMGEEAWEAIHRSDPNYICHFMHEEDDRIESRTAIEWKQWLADNKYCVSAYGTVFNQGNGKGVVADILGFWYTERKRLQAEKKKYTKLLKELKENALITLTSEQMKELNFDEKVDEKETLSINNSKHRQVKM